MMNFNNHDLCFHAPKNTDSSQIQTITTRLSTDLTEAGLSAKQEYKDYQGRRSLQYRENGSLILNSHNLKLLCIKDDLYQFPELNTKLYLHFKCIEKIENLEPYKNIKTLYLQNNVIRKIQGLQQLSQLQNLFLQNNMISQIQNLDHNFQLKVINLSHNNIFRIDNINHLEKLEGISLANNYLKKYQDLQHLGKCAQSLTAIDISNNRIENSIQFVKLIPQVKLLHLAGNPLCQEVKFYRRIVVGSIKTLLYLDFSPITQEQRLISENYLRQGKQGANKVKRQIQIHKNNLKIQKKKEIMKDINIHRKKKVNAFIRDISELQNQIKKLEQQKSSDKTMSIIYCNKMINEKKQKIEQLRQHVKNITDRIKQSE